MHRSLLALLTLVLLAAPAASALEVSFTDEEFTIPADGSYELPVTVSATCQEILAGTTSVSVSTSGLPDYFGAGTNSVDFAATDCLGTSTTVSKATALTFTPTSAAFGLEPHAFQIVAGSVTADHKKMAQVSYVDGHTLAMDQTFPYNMTEADGGVLTWNITIDIQANSQTMVMFQNLQASVGKLSGINHQIFDVESSETTRTLTAKFIAPDFEWTEAIIKFWNYSHCLKGTDCPPTNSQNMTWVITNQAGTINGTPNDDGKESPGVAPVFVGLVLVAATLVVRRSSA